MAKKRTSVIEGSHAHYCCEWLHTSVENITRKDRLQLRVFWFGGQEKTKLLNLLYPKLHLAPLYMKNDLLIGRDTGVWLILRGKMSYWGKPYNLQQYITSAHSESIIQFFYCCLKIWFSMYTKYWSMPLFYSLMFLETEKIIYDSFFLEQNTYEFPELYGQLREALALPQYIWLSRVPPSKKQIQCISENKCKWKWIPLSLHRLWSSPSGITELPYFILSFSLF